MKVALCLLPLGLDASLGLTLTVLQSANQVLLAQGRSPLFELALVGHEAGSVTTGAGLPLRVEQTFAALPRPDLVLVPGAFLPDVPALEPWLERPEVLACVDWLAGLPAARTRLAASCVGSYLLAQAGLLDGMEATTTWWLAPHFRARHPQVRLDLRRMVVDDGRCTTAGAALAQADLLLHLVTRHAGPAVGHACARYLLLDQRPLQSRYVMVDGLARQHPQLRKAEDWVREHLAQPITIPALAQALHLTPRTLARRFQQTLGLSPLRFVQQMRVDQARHLLATTHQSFEQIAHAVGYAQPAMLRRLLRRETGSSPSEMRQRVAAPGAARTKVGLR